MNRNQITFLIYTLIVRDRNQITSSEVVIGDAINDASRLDAKDYEGAMYPVQWSAAQEIADALMPKHQPLGESSDSFTFGAIANAFAVYAMTGDHKIPCIRIIRELTGSGLKSAKQFVDGKTTMDGLKDGYRARLEQAQADCAQIRETANEDLQAAKRLEDRLREENKNALLGQARMSERIDLLTRLADTQTRLIEELS